MNANLSTEVGQVRESPQPTPKISPTTAGGTGNVASCGGCDAKWAGTSRAHCAACHSTFSGPSLFDRHRVNSKCARPESLGFVLDGGTWRTPAPANRPEHWVTT